jgi:prevent-host-death family protein
VSDARARLPEVIEQARDEAVHLTRHGKTRAVIVSPEHYARLIDALDEHDDLVAFDAAIDEEGDSIPWEQVKADLGWE